VNVELKGPGTAAPVHALIQEYIRDHGWKVHDFHISSFRHDELREMRQLNAEVPIGILPQAGPLRALAVAEELDAVSINANHRSLNPDSVAAIRATGLRIYAWTVNDYADIRRLLDLGIDGFITNYPDRVQRLARE
jgi:glycerophosphoryl diester phosphodiesterase